MSALSWHGGEFLDEQMNARRQRLEALTASNPAVESIVASAEDENTRKQDSSENANVTSNSKQRANDFVQNNYGRKETEGEGWNDPVLLRSEPESRKPAFVKDERKAQPIFRIKQPSSEQTAGNNLQWTPPSQESYDNPVPDDEAINEICRRLRPLEVEDSTIETEKLRERSRQWAVRESLTSSQVIELEMLMNLITSTYIPKSSIEGLRQIDKGRPPASSTAALLSLAAHQKTALNETRTRGAGSFGNIYCTLFDKNPAAVKIVTHIAPQSGETIPIKVPPTSPKPPPTPSPSPPGP